MSTWLIFVTAFFYLLVSIGVARTMVWKWEMDIHDDDEGFLIVGAFIFWPAILSIGGPIFLICKLVSIPPSRVRMERRRVRLAEEIQRLERELRVTS